VNSRLRECAVRAGLVLLDLRKQPARQFAPGFASRSLAKQAGRFGTIATLKRCHAEKEPAVAAAGLALGECAPCLGHARHVADAHRSEPEDRRVAAGGIDLLTQAKHHIAGVAVLAVGVIMTSVMPRFAPLFKMRGDALPTPTKVLLWLSEFIRTGWML